MAAPTVTMYLNTGTETTPTWTEVLSTHTTYFTGPATTASTLDPVIKPDSGSKVAEELWFGPSGTYTQCATYTGAVNTNQNVLRLYFATNPTATAPILTAYHSSADRSTLTKEILAGTAGTSNKGFMKAKETTAAAPGVGWCTVSTGAAGAADPNDLKGDTDYVQAASAAAANTQKLFNIVCFVPSDSGTGTTGHDPSLACKYTYT